VVGRTKIGVWVLIVLLLAMPFSVAMSTLGSGGSDGSGSRASWTITRFDEARIPIEVNFEEDPDNRTYHVSVPNSGLITSASMTLEGIERYSLVGTVWDLSDNTTSNGHEGYTTQYPPKSSPSAISSGLNVAPISDLGRDEVRSLDGDVLMTATSWNNQPPPHQYPFHLFEIKVNKTDMVRLEIEWHGWGNNDFNLTNTHGAEIWIWNQTDTAWEPLDSYGANDTSDVVHKLTYLFKEPYDYTSRYGRVHILAFGTRDERGPVMSNPGSIGTDYVAYTVFKNGTLQLPSDVEVAIGDQDPFWDNVGEFSSPVTLGDGEGLKGAIQTYVAGVPPSTEDVMVPFIFSVGEATFGTVKVSALSVGVQEYTNQPPTFLGARTIEMTEDVDLPRAFDLWDHYEDDLQGTDLNYTVAYQENTSLVRAEIHTDGHHVSFFTVSEHWSGTLEFRFNATDLWGLSTVSGSFDVTVDEVNDPPVFVDPGDQYLDENAAFELNLTVIDPDLLYGDSLTFEDDSDLFDIEPTTGRIALTPDQEDVGEYVVTFTVHDEAGEEAFLVITFHVSDVNDRPTIVDPGILVAYEGQRFDFNLTATDDDLKESITWQLVGGVGSMRLGAQNGWLSWIPKGEHVGMVNVSVIATDKRGASDQRAILIEVRNINDQPVMDTLDPIQLTEGERFIHNVVFTDPDIDVDPGETHTFTVDPPLFGIGPTGLVDFTPDNVDVGYYLLNVTITDGAGASHTLEWEVDVANVNQPPTIDQVEDQIWKEDEPTYLQVIAFDPDVGDVLTFSDTTSMFEIDPTEGVINFTPVQTNVGIHQLQIRVTDAAGQAATVYFEVTVLAVNDPPVLDIRVDSLKEVLREGDALSLAAEVEDEDSRRDDLHYTWFLNGKEKGNEDSIVLRNLASGDHTVELRVEDGENVETTQYQFTVRAIEEEFPWVTLIIVVILVVVALVITVRPLMRLLKGSQKKPVVEVPDEEPEAPPEEPLYPF
jgi:hypothetical protein